MDFFGFMTIFISFLMMEIGYRFISHLKKNIN